MFITKKGFQKYIDRQIAESRALIRNQVEMEILHLNDQFLKMSDFLKNKKEDETIKVLKEISAALWLGKRDEQTGSNEQG